MAVSQGYLLPDCSTNANYNAWSVFISNALASFGWVQTNDTGQVVWTATVLTFTQITIGTPAVYAYSSFTGPVPRVGMSVIVTGFANGGNNTTIVLTAVSGGASGTVSGTNAGAVNETHAGSGTTTAESTTPGNVTRDYEIWKSMDALSSGGGSFQVFLKIFYGNSTNSPNMIWSLATATNGAGVLTNPTTSTTLACTSSSTTIFQTCNASGDSGNFRLMMWHATGSTGAGPSAFISFIINIERSLSTTGAYTNAYVTLWAKGGNSSTLQQTLFSNGAITTQETSGAATILPTTATTGNVGPTTAFSPPFPLIGGPGNPCIGLAYFRNVDFADNVPVIAVYYGIAHTYLTGPNGTTFHTSLSVTSGVAIRYE